MTRTIPDSLRHEITHDLEGLDGLTVEEIRPWHSNGLSVRMRAAGREVHLYHQPGKPWRAHWGLMERTGLTRRGALIGLGMAIRDRNADLVSVLLGSLHRRER
jgi:hypothetical protein